MQPNESWTGIAKTALGVATVRALESRRPDRLFDDPYAQAFLDAAPRVLPEEPRAAGERASLGPLASLGAVFAFHGVIRTRFFDDYLLAACRGGCRQVVVLAAGLDTRAYRLAWPAGTHLFEIDLPDVLRFKGQVLAQETAVPRCAHTIVAADLREDWSAELTNAGFQATTATAWLAEGLLIYLDADEAAGMLAAITQRSAAGSQLSFERGDMANSALLTQTRALPAMDQFTSLWKGGLGPDDSAWLTGHGWRCQTHDLVTIAASYGRSAPADSKGGFITALRE